jgi:hypothetical protein
VQRIRGAREATLAGDFGKGFELAQGNSAACHL